jgi:hypothetical protein
MEADELFMLARGKKLMRFYILSCWNIYDEILWVREFKNQCIYKSEIAL